MCEYCKVYTDEEIDKIEEDGIDYDMGRIEEEISELGDEEIDLGYLGNIILSLNLEITEERHELKAIICRNYSDAVAIHKEIKYCPMCGRKL